MSATKKILPSQKKPLLVKPKKVEAPPTETTRLLAAMLDGKTRPRNRPKKAANIRIKSTSDSVGTPTDKRRSTFDLMSLPRPASNGFGASKGLSQLPKPLKRKWSDMAREFCICLERECISS